MVCRVSYLCVMLTRAWPWHFHPCPSGCRWSTCYPVPRMPLGSQMERMHTSLPTMTSGGWHWPVDVNIKIRQRSMELFHSVITSASYHIWTAGGPPLNPLLQPCLITGIDVGNRGALLDSFNLLKQILCVCLFIYIYIYINNWCFYFITT